MSDWLVQRGLATFGASGPGPVSVSVVLSSATDPARAFPRPQGSRSGGAGRDTPATANLNNDDLGAVLGGWSGTGFDLERNTTAELEDHRYYWEVIEEALPLDQRIQHGMFVRDVNSRRMGPGSAGPVTLAAVSSITDITKAFLWPLGLRSDATSPVWSSAQIMAHLDALKRPVLQRGGSTGNATLSYAVIELGLAWTVRRVTVSTAVAGSDVAVSGCGPEPWSEKVYVPSWLLPSGAETLADSPLFRPSLTDPDVLLFYRSSAGTAGTFAASAYVLHHPRLVVRHLSSLDGYPLIGGQDVVDDETGIGTAVDPDRTSVIGMASNSGPVAEYPWGSWGWTLASTGESVLWRRGRADGTRQSHFSLQVVGWPEIPRGGSVVERGAGYWSRAEG